MANKAPSAQELRSVILQLSEWLEDDGAVLPTRSDSRHELVADAVRGAAFTLEELAPGHSVEVRIPPFVAVQCVAGPRHTRGTPSNVVQTDPHSWLRLVTGLLSWEDAQQQNLLSASGSRSSEVSHWLPLVPISAHHLSPRRKS